jgi:hypothetical protein
VKKRVGGEEGDVRRRWTLESEGDWMPLLTFEGRRLIHAGFRLAAEVKGERMSVDVGRVNLFRGSRGWKSEHGSRGVNNDIFPKAFSG